MQNSVSRFPKQNRSTSRSSLLIICSSIRKRRIRSSHPPIARCLFTRSRGISGRERNFHGGEISFLSRAILTHSQSPFASDSPLSTDYIKDSRRMLRQILLLLLFLPLPRNPCASERARLRRQRDLNDHIHRIQFSLSSRGKMPAGVHDALLTLNADGCEIECQPAELKGLPRGSEKSWKRDRGGEREEGMAALDPSDLSTFCVSANCLAS